MRDTQHYETINGKQCLVTDLGVDSYAAAKANRDRQPHTNPWWDEFEKVRNSIPEPTWIPASRRPQAIQETALRRMNNVPEQGQPKNEHPNLEPTSSGNLPEPNTTVHPLLLCEESRTGVPTGSNVSEPQSG